MKKTLFPVVLILLFCTGCARPFLPFFDCFELWILNDSLTRFYFSAHRFPTSREVDSLTKTDPSFKRFSSVAIKPSSDSSALRLVIDYHALEHNLQSVDINLFSAGRPGLGLEYNSVVYQRDIHVWPNEVRPPDNRPAQRLIKKSNRVRKRTRFLLIENTETGRTRKVKITNTISPFASADTSFRYEPADRPLFMSRKHFWQTEWVLESINTSDSTLTLTPRHGWSRRQHLRISSIDSLFVSRKSAPYRVVGIREKRRPGGG
jgi:hypothetical protein